MKTTIAIIFTLASTLLAEEPQANGELILIIEGAQEYPITVVKVSNSISWGKASDGFPVTSAYDGPYQRTGNGFTADHVEGIDSNPSRVLAYGLYALIIKVGDQNHGIYVDYRDADYVTTSLYTNGDLTISYYPSTNTWKAEDVIVLENSVVPFWMTQNKPTGINNLNPFTPTNPTALFIVNHSGNPLLEWWNSEPSVAKYNIYRNNIKIAGPISSTSYIDYDISMGSGLLQTYKIRAESGDGSKLSPSYSNSVAIHGNMLDEKIELVQIGDRSTINSIYPNPFNPQAKVNFTVVNEGTVRIKVFDMLGRELQTVLNKTMTIGNHEIIFDALNYSGGMYFFRLENGTDIDSKKFVLTK